MRVRDARPIEILQCVHGLTALLLNSSVLIHALLETEETKEIKELLSHFGELRKEYS